MNSRDKNGPAAPVSTTPAVAPASEATLGDLLRSAEGAVRAHEANRRESERLMQKNPMDGFMHQAYAASYTSFDPWENVPAARAIKAYTNREFALDLVPEALRRVRGRVCEVLDIDTTAADELPLSRVVQALRQPAPETTKHAGPRWLRVTDVAKTLGMSAGRVSRLATAGKLTTNGKTGSDRRIDALSVVPFEVARVNQQARRDTA